MDKFVKGIMTIAIAGSIACAIHGFIAEEDKLFAKDEQEYVTNAKWAEENNVYGGIFAHLEKEKTFLAWADKNGRYIADVYYTGDHYEDPRLMIIHDESGETVVQVILTESYKKRSEDYYKEVPE